MAQSASIGESYRRLRALCLLILFVGVQGAPVLAGTGPDAMGGMSCCKRGRESCCRRKPPAQTAPAIQSGHPCGLSCAGIPAVPPQTEPFLLPVHISARDLPELSFASDVPSPGFAASAQMPAIHWQRPPPAMAYQSESVSIR